MTYRHPLHDERFIELLAEPSSNQWYGRRTGKSTAQALMYLSSAITNPYTRIPIGDHYGTKQATHHLLCMIEDCVRSLDLKHIKVNKASQYIVFSESDDV